MTQVDPGTVAARLDDVRARVAAAGGDPGAVRIVAVTKGFGPGTARAAVAAGLADLGENYAQELLGKAGAAQELLGEAGAAPPPVRWHFLGPVQRNKVRRLAPLVSAWHGIDRPVAADAVASARPGAEVLVEVNVTGAAGRPGCAPDEVDSLVDHCRRRPVKLTGLMAVAPAGDREEARACFRWLARRAEVLGLPELSMGMSEDFEVAIEEGATTLRLGRVLFGPRPRRASVQR